LPPASSAGAGLDPTRGRCPLGSRQGRALGTRSFGRVREWRCGAGPLLGRRAENRTSLGGAVWPAIQTGRCNDLLKLDWRGRLVGPLSER